MHNIAIALGIVIGIAFLIFAYSLYIKFTSNRQYNKASSATSSTTLTAGPSNVTCPLCNSRLLKGENLSSRVFRPIKDGVESDQRCTILGCPHCLPHCQNGAKRLCPVCGKSVPPDGYLVARLFTNTRGKRHVRISGCSECHKKV